MEPEHHRAFGPFHVDGTQGHLWRGEQRIALRPQSLALLRYLVAHPGRLVTKAEVRQHVWAGMHITDTVLRVSVHEIREALGDAAAAPRYLETVGRQGYRFLLGEDLEVPPAVGRPPRRTPGRGRGLRPVLPASGPVPASASCSVAKPIGIGKTTVVDMVLARLGTGSGVRIARGQCVEHYGEGEAYLPSWRRSGSSAAGHGTRPW